MAEFEIFENNNPGVKLNVYWENPEKKKLLPGCVFQRMMMVKD